MPGEWWIYALPFAALLGLFPVLYWFINRGGKRAREEFAQKYADRVILIDGCGVVTGYNRVPGVLVLLDDRLAYRAMVLGAEDEIPFDRIKNWTLESTRETSRRRARKYRRAQVLILDLTEGEAPLFVLSDQKAPVWAEQLAARVGRT